MNKPLVNALKAMAVLVTITAVCVALLTVCNMFFPTYEPVLDAKTASLINGICPTGQTDEAAFADGYIVILSETDIGVELNKFNKDNKTRKGVALAVYKQVKGDNVGAYIIESRASGRDGNVVILTAYVGDKIVGATVKKQGESYWNKLPEDLFSYLEGSDAYGTPNLGDLVGKTGATISLGAINRAVDISNALYKQICEVNAA